MPDPVDDDELSSADVVAIYTLYEGEVSKIWLELAEANPNTTMRDAVKEWKRRQESTDAAN
jgi:(p)ppGpp synthase/HD superfamily hydrolase